MGVLSELSKNTSWDWQQVILAAAVAKQHRTLDADDYDRISDLIADIHEVPEYAAKAFTAAVKYLAKRLEKYRDTSRADSSVYVKPLSGDNRQVLADMISIMSGRTRGLGNIIQKVTEVNTTPVGLPCPRCGNTEGFTKSQMLFGGPYSGGVSCACGYRNSVIGFLGRSMFTVEPLPDGAVPIYTKDPEDE